ncbi:Proline iminopeptidase [Podosphaera aphanis]|nr:Proline iminopeptidase [Podosphaera aphanis]
MESVKLLRTKSHLLPGMLKVSELFFEAPVDYSNPKFGSIQLFARSVLKFENSIKIEKDTQKPWLVYLQGGPGYGCPAPQNSPLTKTILEKGYQILFLDQRGTGLSNPISADSLALHGDAQTQFNYLKHFRADNIVRDCEAIRGILTQAYPTELKKWSVFGQSFGGFCVFTYLSKYPNGLREAFTTGGIPPICQTPQDVYEATFKKVIERNKAYYAKFPEDIDAVHTLAIHIRKNGGLTLPSGATLTVRSFLTLGRAFGFHGGLDTVHELILHMQSDLDQFKFITRPTLSALERAISFDDAILYAVLHEAIYCEHEASNWAAERVGKSLSNFKWLREDLTTESGIRESPLYFSGEMIFPFLFEVSEELKKLSAVAQEAAHHNAWPALYDCFQLSQNTVPLYAASFVDDMYVDFGLAQETVKLVSNCKQYITNTLYHNALRANTSDLMKELFALRNDTID